MSTGARQWLVSVLSRFVFVFSLFGVSASLITRTWCGTVLYVVFAFVAVAVFLRARRMQRRTTDEHGRDRGHLQ